MKRFDYDIVNQRFHHARYFRCGVKGELVLYIVSFKNSGYADACGWESRQAIDNASKDFEKTNHISSLQSIHAVIDACTRSSSCQWALRR